MRILKIFLFTAIAVGAFMAYVGATSAMAVTSLEEVLLCDQNTSPCPAGHDLGAGTVFHSELKAGTNFVVLSAAGNFTCTESTILGHIETGELLAHGLIEAMNLENCSKGSNTCTVEMLHLSYLIEGELKATHSGYEVLVSERGTNGPFEYRMVCPGIDCEYSSSSLLFEQITGANDVAFKISQKISSLNFLCGFAGEPVLDAEYLTRCLKPAGTEIGCWLVMES